MDKELIAAKRKLNQDNKKLILKMEQYLESHYINEVSGEEILSDVVGMALECQQRNESFLQAIGGDSEAFCRELIRNSPRQSVIERVMNVLRWLFFFSAFLVPGLYFIELLFPKWSPATVDGLIYEVPRSFLFKYYIITVVLIIGWFIVRMFTYKPMRYVFGIYFAVFMLFFLSTDAILNFVIGNNSLRVPIWIPTIVLAIITVVCDLIRRLTAITTAYHRNKGNIKDVTKE